MSSNEIDMNQPIPAGEPIPHRKVIRSWLTPLTERVVVKAIILQILDTVILTAGLIGTVYFESIWVKLLLAIFSCFCNAVEHLVANYCHKGGVDNSTKCEFSTGP